MAALARGGGAAASGGGAPATQKTKSGLELKDVRAGRGNAAKSGDRVSVKYRGTLTNGKQFDAGSIDFASAAARYIWRWDEGVAGMRVGGSRQLRVPSGTGVRQARRAAHDPAERDAALRRRAEAVRRGGAIFH